jgi:Domain of Unknown Function (DUF1080)
MPQASPVFCQQPLERLVVEPRVGQELLQPPVLLLERFQPLGVRDRHAAVLGPPLVEGRRRDVVPAAQLRQLRPVEQLRCSTVLPDDADDLLVGEPARAHLSSSRTKVEQILPYRGPVSGGRVTLNAAVGQGHEVQIDERGFDSATNTEGHAQKRTGAIYDLQAPSAFPSNPVGAWSSYEIQANNNEIRVRLNGQEVNVFQSTRQAQGFLALQAYAPASRVQFRNARIKKLP